MPSSTPPSGRRDLGAPIFSATPTGPRPSQEPEAESPTTMMEMEPSSTPHNDLEGFIQNPYTNQTASTGDAATTHTLQQTSNPNAYARHHANPRNYEQQSSHSGIDKHRNKDNTMNDPDSQADYRRQRRLYLIRLHRSRSRRQPQPSSMALLTDALSTLTTTDAPAPAPTLNHREANLRSLQRETRERLAWQRARNREMNARQAKRQSMRRRRDVERKRDVERRIQAGENLSREEGAGGAGDGGLSIADGFCMI